MTREKVNFDIHSQNYREFLRSSMGFCGRNDDFFDIIKIYYIKKWVIDINKIYDILDFGCGIGKLTSFLARDFPNFSIHGYDVSEESLRIAKSENSDLKNALFTSSLSDEKKYDLVIASNVFHHIDPNEHLNVLEGMKKILNKKGMIVIFEHNPFNPLTRHIVNRCSFDKDARLVYRCKFMNLARIAKFRVVKKPYILFFPWRANIFRNLENLLIHIPFGAQYMLLLESS